MIETSDTIDWLLALVCTPSCLVATALNIIFIFCLCWSVEGASIRQPLYFLLTVMLGNSTIHQLIVLISVIMRFFVPPIWILGLNGEIICKTFSSSFSTCAWISFFYYLKIVPQGYTILIWIKRNIKMIIFAGFVFDQVLLMSAVTMNTMAHNGYDNSSVTSYLNETSINGISVFKSTLLDLSMTVYLLYVIGPLCTLTCSWGKTFLYLIGHIKKMKRTSSSSCTLQMTQMRVTIMGIAQTAVFIPSSLWVITITWLFVLEHKTENYFITMTISSVCGLANILCLGFSQSVFRVQIISSFRRVKKSFGM